MDFTQFLPLGIGGVLAAITANWKHEDDKKHAEDLKTLTARHDEEMKSIIMRMENRDERMLTILQGNTEALRSLQSAIQILIDVDKLEERLSKHGGR